MHVSRFATGIIVITFLTLLLTQLDKVLLSRLLTLEAFGYYALAGVIANALYMLVGPICTAFYPRFTELTERGDSIGLRATYHQAAQLTTVLMGSAAVVLIFFSSSVLLLWSGDHALAELVAPLVSALALGTLLNGLMGIPYGLQLAYGWTSLKIKISAIAVVVLVPLLLWAVPRYGALGAAYVWVLLTAGHILFGVGLMHRRLLLADKWRWCFQDVAMPLAAASVAASLCFLLAPDSVNRWAQLGVLLPSAGCILIAAVLGAPMVRCHICLLYRSWTTGVIVATKESSRVTMVGKPEIYPP